jgi:hypothetical protein
VLLTGTAIATPTRARTTWMMKSFILNVWNVGYWLKGEKTLLRGFELI